MTSRSGMLDIARWVAALLVITGHVRSIFFEDYNSNIHNIFYKGIYFITGLGHQAVTIFFVLSGYLIGKSIIDKYKTKTFSLSFYLVSRFTRIYIVLIPALLLTYILDKAGFLFDKTGIYTTCDYITSFQKDPAGRLTLAHFISSLVMLQNIWLPTFGSNGPLWSLSPEFWCYLFFPLIAGLFFKLFNYKHFIIYPILIFVFFYLIPNWIISYFLIWLCGLIPYFIGKQGSIIRYVSFFLLGGILIYSRIYILNFWGEFMIAILLAFIVSSFDDQKINIVRSNLHKRLASFSYSLYLIHYPLALFFLVIINRFIMPAIKIEMNIYTLFLYLIILLAVYLASFLFAKATEYQTDRLRKKLS